jgi:uncharacterized membrane protein (UPF0127 family)
MKNIILGIAVLIILMVLVGIYTFLLNKNSPRKSVQIKNSLFMVEIADNAITQARGLSGRDQLGKDEGMLFVFPNERTRSFWMAGMKFPLDIIWIKGNTVVGISRNLHPATAENMQIASSPGAVDLVLEINAGLSDELGIQAGDSVIVSK